MTYSRSRTQSQQKSKRRSRTKVLLVINGVLIGCIAVAAWLVWSSNHDGGEPGKPSVQQSASPDRDQAAADSEPPEPSGTSSVPSAEASEDASDEQSGQSSSEPSGDSLSLAFVGDILPAAKVLDLMKINGFDYPFRGAKDALKSADITAGNLETPITDRGTPAKNKQYVFRGSAEAIPEIKNAGFDFLSLANNHTLDYGWDGLSDTMDALDDAGLQHAGSGIDDKEAYSPAYIESKGMTVGFISLTRVVPEVGWKADRNHPGVAEAYSPDRAVEAIKEAKSNADIVVVMVHWGVERAERPVAHQTDLGHRFIDAGADLVIGSHPHVLQGFEAYKGKWIAYSLGNFVFSTTASSLTSETGVLHASCAKDGNCSLKLEPMFAKNSQPAPMEDGVGKALLARLSTVSYGATVEEDGTIVASSD